MGIQFFSRAQAPADTVASVRDAASQSNDIPLEPPGRGREPEPKPSRARALVRRCPAWLGSCFAGVRPSRENRRPVAELAGARYATTRLHGYNPVDLRKGMNSHLGTMLSVGGPGGGRDTNEIIELFAALMTDLATLIETSEKYFDFEFGRVAQNYAGYILLPSPDKEKRKEHRDLLTRVLAHLSKHLDSLVRRAETTGTKVPKSPATPAGPVQPPVAASLPRRFDAVATSMAYEIIKKAHDEKWGRMEAEVLASVEPTPALMEAPEASTAVSAPSAPLERGSVAAKRADAAIRAELEALNRLNKIFKQWLKERHIEAVPCSGVGLDCMLNSSTQQFTGAYDIQQFDNRQWRRIVNEKGALQSDSVGVRAAFTAMNAALETNIDVIVVSADEQGLPRIISRSNTGSNPVVLWHKGDHYEALRFRTDWAEAAKQSAKVPDPAPAPDSGS